MNLHERKLSYQARKRLPSSDFVFPKERKYPIEDKAHARNALARVSQHGSPSQQAAVRSAVHSKYPGIGESKWIAGAINKKHKGWCTPLSNPHCTGRRRALALRFKKGDLHHESLIDRLIPPPPQA